VTYALTSAGLWVNRANTAWGSSRQYNIGNSFETDLATMTTDRNNWQSSSTTWQGRANSAWGDTRTWNSGASFETNRNAAYDSGTWGVGNLWSTDYTNLLNGLNNPEGLQQQGFPISHNSGGSESFYGTFSFGRTGHFFVSVLLPTHGPNITQGNSSSTLRLAGSAGITLNQNFNVGTNSGSTSRDWLHGSVWDVNTSAGATIDIYFNSFVCGNPTTGTCTVYAHFVPNATYHN
jgi:hypothetical protein